MTEYTVDRQTDKCYGQCRGLLFVEVYIQCIVFRLPLIAVVVVLSGARVFEATCADAGVTQREELDTFSNRYLTAATTAVSIVFHWVLHPCITVFRIHKSNLLHQRDIDLLFGTWKKDKIVCSGRVPFSNGYASLMFL